MSRLGFEARLAASHLNQRAAYGAGMALHVVASRVGPAEKTALLEPCPGRLPSSDWPEEYVVPLPRGLSRHVVRIVRAGGRRWR